VTTAVRVLAGCVVFFTAGCVLATIAATLPAGEAVVAVAAGEMLPTGAPFAHPVANPVMISTRPIAPPTMPAIFRLVPSRIPIRITIPYPCYIYDASGRVVDY